MFERLHNITLFPCCTCNILYVGGLPCMTSAKFSDSLTPPVRKFTQPPLLRLLTMSAFEGTPSPLSVDVINGSPPRNLQINYSLWPLMQVGHRLTDGGSTPSAVQFVNSPQSSRSGSQDHQLHSSSWTQNLWQPSTSSEDLKATEYSY